MAALENGLSQIEEGAGRFPQVAGMKFSFDKSKPAGSRVVSVEMKEGDAFVPLDPAKVYTLASNNYMRAGGDGYKIFATAAQNAYDYGPTLDQVVADYLAANRPYKPYTDGRITRRRWPERRRMRLRARRRPDAAATATPTPSRPLPAARRSTSSSAATRSGTSPRRPMARAISGGRSPRPTAIRSRGPSRSARNCRSRPGKRDNLSPHFRRSGLSRAGVSF